MSDEGRERAWETWRDSNYPFPLTASRRLAFMAGYDAATARMAQLEAALRTAREALVMRGKPIGGRQYDAALAEIDATLGETV